MALKCSFCAKNERDVKMLIANEPSTACICDGCVERAVDVVDRAREKKRAEKAAAQVAA